MDLFRNVLGVEFGDMGISRFHGGESHNESVKGTCESISGPAIVLDLPDHHEESQRSSPSDGSRMFAAQFLNLGAGLGEAVLKLGRASGFVIAVFVVVHVFVLFAAFRSVPFGNAIGPEVSAGCKK